MLNRGFGNSLFNMVPKANFCLNSSRDCFRNNLFNMVPKVFEKRSSDPKCFGFGNSLFNIVPKDLRF